MSKTVEITSSGHFEQLRQSSRILVSDFYADWCVPCKQIHPFYEDLSARLSQPKTVTFCRVNVDSQPEISRKYGVTAMPTFIIFRAGSQLQTIRGAIPRELQSAVRTLVSEVQSSSSSDPSSSSDSWLALPARGGYKDVTTEIDVKGLDILNADSAFGGLRTLISGSRPSALGENGKTTAGAGEGDEGKDWVESDTDEQLMLYIPFQVSIKAHTMQLTSIPSASSPSEDVMRPKTIHIYSNRSHILGFDEAESVPPTQTHTLQESDWDEETGTARIELRFVKFQNVTSLCIFVVDGEGDGERVRLDRVRVLGEAGEKMGKLEKVGHEE